MAQEACFNPNADSLMPIDGNGSFLESSSSSISPRNEACVLPVDLPLSILKMAELNANLASGDLYSTLLDKFANQGSGAGISSLFQSGSYLQRSGNAGMDHYLNLPSAPPKSSLGNNLTSSTMDGALVPHQSYISDRKCQEGDKIEQLPKGSAPLSESVLPNHQFSFGMGLKPDCNTLIQMLKKPRIDVNNDFSKEQIIQQLLLREDIRQLEDINPQLRVLLIQHQRQQILDSLPQLRGLQAHQADQHYRHQCQQPATCPSSSRVDGICSQRLMQCLYNMRNRPQDNNIDFWRRIVSEFYAPCAKERWCLSSYQNIGQHTLGILSLGAVGAWCCDLCGSKSGKGFEASFEVLPRLWQIKFESGVLEEILYLDIPREHRLPSGAMLLEYEKAVQQSVYEKCRVIHEGKLRVIFRPDLKILSWEFCAIHHDEYFLRRLIAPQVNHLMSVAQRYQALLSEGSPEDKIPLEKLRASHDMFAKAGNQFTASLELPTVNELGFSKRYVRCIQIAEVLNIMKDLMTFSHDQKLGPIESLRAYHHQRTGRGSHGRTINAEEEEEQEISQEGSIQSVLTNGNISTGKNVDLDGHDRAGEMEQLMAANYQRILRESRVNPRANTISQRGISSSCLDQGSSSNLGLVHNSILSGLQSSESSEASKNMQQQSAIDKLLQNALRKHNEQAFREASENKFSGLPTGTRGTILGNSSTAAVLGQGNLLGNICGNAESSKGVTSSSDSLKVAGSKMGIKRERDMPE